jgi:hypothetical protein
MSLSLNLEIQDLTNPIFIPMFTNKKIRRTW